MLLVAHELNGELKTIQPLKTSDLDLCGMHQQHINFGENLASACQLDLRTLIDLGEQKPWFLNLYLNYTENNQNLVKAVPILIQNAFTYNMVILNNISKSLLYISSFSLFCIFFFFAESIRSREMAIGETNFLG